MSPTRVATGIEATNSSHIKEMIKKLVQPEGLGVSATIVTEEPSSKSSLPKNLPSSDSQLDKRIKILYILSFLSLLLASTL